jgi:hypothetical protein
MLFNYKPKQLLPTVSNYNPWYITGEIAFNVFAKFDTFCEISQAYT